jgi:hypothetical protein
LDINHIYHTEFEEQLSKSGITLWLAAINPEPLRNIERSQLGKALGHERKLFIMEQVADDSQAIAEEATQKEIS